MKKVLKITGIVVASFIGLLLIAAILIPILFKDDIKKAVDQAIADNINAEIIYQTEDISLSILSSFPNLSFGIDKLTVKNYAPFQGDTLAHIGSFRIVINLMDYLKHDQISIKKINLSSPILHLKTRKDGTSNYNIVKPSTETETDTTSSSPIHLVLDVWKIENAEVFYEDSSLQTYVYVRGMDQVGNAKLNGDLLHTAVNTTIASLSANYGKVSYLKDHTVESKVNLEIAKNYTLYTLKENEIRINQFALQSEGMFEMRPDSSYYMDLRIASANNSFKNLLSMVPAIYKKDYSDIKTEGTLSFLAHIKGAYSDREHKSPAFNVNLKVGDASFKYPSLPLPVKDIFVDVNIANADGVIDNTNVFIHQFKLAIENDPFSLTGEIRGLKNYTLNSVGKFNLGNVKKIYPISGMDLSGLFSFSLLSKGNVDDVQAGKYHLMQNEGTLSVKDMVLKMDSIPSVRISESDVTMKGQTIRVDRLNMNIGKSDMQLVGQVNDYLNYLFTPQGILKGDFLFTSRNLDLNEWMSSDESSNKQPVKEETPKPSSTSSIYPIPKNVDITLRSTIQHIAMMNMPMDNLKGNLLVKDGMITINKTTFNLLKGGFLVSGVYNTIDPKNVFMDMDLKMTDLSIQEAYKTFNTIRKLAPIAENIIGKMDVDMTLHTLIGNDYFPIYSSMKGKGVVKTQDIGMQGFQLMNSVADVTKIKELKDPKFSPGRLQFEIKDGKLITDPFDVTIGGTIKTNVAGSTTLDGDVDYTLKADVPAKQGNEYLKQIMGGDVAQYNFIESIPVTVYCKGKYNKIKPSIVPDKQKLNDAVKSQVKQKTTEVKNSVVESTKDAVKSIVDPNDKRSQQEKINSAIDEGKKKILNLFGKPK